MGSHNQGRWVRTAAGWHWSRPTQSPIPLENLHRCFAKGFADGLRGTPADGVIIGTDYVACYLAGLRMGSFTRDLMR